MSDKEKTTQETTQEITQTAAEDTALTHVAPDLPLPNTADPRRLVKIKLQMDKKKGKGLYVNVNDHRYFIPRGEVVEVPYYIAAVLNNSAKQDEETAKLIEELGENADKF